MPRMPKVPARQNVPAEAEAPSVAAALEQVRVDLQRHALVDVMTDGSRKASAALAVVDALISGLRAEGDRELLELRRRASPTPLLRPRERSDELDLLFEIFRATYGAERVQELLRGRRYDDAGAELGNQLVDAVIGVADLFENLRRDLPPVQSLEALRPEVAAVLSLRLEMDDQDDAWCEGTLRGVLRAWGISATDAERMTDFIRKRRKK